MSKKPKSEAQAAIEYMVALALMTVIALVGFNTFLHESRDQANMYFNDIARNIYENRSIDRTYGYFP